MNEERLISKDGWRELPTNEGLTIPSSVVNKAAYLIRDKIARYVDMHRHYRYIAPSGEELTIDCRMSPRWIRRRMEHVGADSSDIEQALRINRELLHFNGKLSEYTRKAYGARNSNTSVLDARGEELIDMFGKLYTLDEVHQKIVQEWGMNVSREALSKFYHRNLNQIERLRDQLCSDFSDLSLSRKRARLDRLSILFYTYYNKWSKDPRLEYARELRATLEQIKREIEGEHVSIDFQGHINVDLTIELNRTISQIQQRIPINNLIIALTASRRNIDPTHLMTQLNTSYYSHMTGFGHYAPDRQTVHPLDLTYNWNEITSRAQTLPDEDSLVQDAQVMTSTGDVERDAQMENVRERLKALLQREIQNNNQRNTKP